jgi:signal transduction histidine kinase
LLASLPQGGSLPDAQWIARHRAIQLLLWAHVVGIPVFALVRGYGFGHGLLEAAPTAAFSVLAALPGRSRKFQSTVAALGLFASSAVLVHLSGGTIEAHFHFFVVVGVLTLYEDWLPFLVAIGFTALHHGVMGALDPKAVYNHRSAWEHPWTWAAIHAAFVIAASAVLLVAWRMNETVRSQLSGALEELRRSDLERRRLLNKLLRTREDEGKRIAAELHDGPIQRLTRLDYMLERAAVRLDAGEPQAAGELVGESQVGLRGEIQQLRHVMSELRPPALDERGLEAALRDHVRRIEQASGVRCRFECEVADRLRPSVEEVLYRVAQEALTNVVKHARAANAWISLSAPDGIVSLRVRDDGVGLDPVATLSMAGADHFGLMAMRERVHMEEGTYEVHSSPGNGTEIRVSFRKEEALQ